MASIPGLVGLAGELISEPDVPQPAVMPIATATVKATIVCLMGFLLMRSKLSAGSAHVVSGQCQNADFGMTVRGCAVGRPVDP
jgi:hypothetical protein